MNEIAKLIKYKEINFEDSKYAHLSATTINLLKACLTKDKKKRPTVAHLIKDGFSNEHVVHKMRKSIQQ